MTRLLGIAAYLLTGPGGPDALGWILVLVLVTEAAVSHRLAEYEWWAEALKGSRVGGPSGSSGEL